MIGRHFEDSNRRERDEAYALRRTLIRRLQANARGVTRRERVERHGQFAMEWETFVAERRLSELQEALHRGLQGNPSWAPGHSGFLLELASVSAVAETRIAPKTDVSRLHSQWDEGRRAPNVAAQAQAELFELERSA